MSEVFGRLRQATLSSSKITTLFYPSTATLPSGDKSTFATSMGSGRAGCGGRGCGHCEQGGKVVEDVASISALIVMVRIIH